MSRKKFYVLDTSALLTNADCIYSYGNNDLIIPFKVSAESYFDKMKDKMSDISNDLIIQAEELSDADIDSITDGITSNIDNVLSIVKDLKNLEGMNSKMLALLAQHNIISLDDFAGLSNFDILNSEEGIFRNLGLDETIVNPMIMKAREKWFEDEKES